MIKNIELRVDLSKITWLRNIEYKKIGLYQLRVKFNSEILDYFNYELTERKDLIVFVNVLKFLDYCDDIKFLNGKLLIKDKQLIIKIIEKKVGNYNG